MSYCRTTIVEFNSEKLADEAISLPIHTEFESSNQDYIIDKITNYFL